MPPSGAIVTVLAILAPFINIQSYLLTYLLQEIVRVGRVGEDPREDVGVGVGVSVVECELIQT